jgi:K+-transporting ATPase KdpF subunit
MSTSIFLTVSGPIEIATSLGYLFGALVALFVFAFLIYTLIKPEKF